MSHILATAITITLSLFLIIGVFFEDSVNAGIKYIALIAIFFILLSYILYSRQRKKNKVNRDKRKVEHQRLFNDNIDWLQKRWRRLEVEKHSGVLRTEDRCYYDRASEKQISQIKDIGLDLDTENLTQGHVSDINGLFESVEEHNVEILLNQRIPLDGMNRTKARESLATVLKDLVETRNGVSNIIEHMIIKQLTSDFVHFARFFDSHVSNRKNLPEYVPTNDRNRIRYEQAADLGLALKGAEIPLDRKLNTLKLDQLCDLAGNPGISSKNAAIKISMEKPDIAKRFDSVAPVDNWFQLKNVKLDVGYMESKWIELKGDHSNTGS